MSAAALAWSAAGCPAHPYDEAPAHTLDDILTRCPVPVAYYAGRQPVGALALNRGWTAPYWYSPWWADCVVPA